MPQYPKWKTQKSIDLVRVFVLLKWNSDSDADFEGFATPPSVSKSSDPSSRGFTSVLNLYFYRGLTGLFNLRGPDKHAHRTIVRDESLPGHASSVYCDDL